jgi:hypothetical protein
VEPAPTRATSAEPSPPPAILTPTRDQNPDDHQDDHDRERSGLIAASIKENTLTFSIDGTELKNVTLPAVATGGISLFSSSEDQTATATFRDLTVTGAQGRHLAAVATPAGTGELGR